MGAHIGVHCATCLLVNELVADAILHCFKCLVFFYVYMLYDAPSTSCLGSFQLVTINCALGHYFAL